MLAGPHTAPQPGEEARARRIRDATYAVDITPAQDERWSTWFARADEAVGLFEDRQRWVQAGFTEYDRRKFGLTAEQRDARRARDETSIGCGAAPDFGASHGATHGYDVAADATPPSLSRRRSAPMDSAVHNANKMWNQ